MSDLGALALRIFQMFTQPLRQVIVVRVKKGDMRALRHINASIARRRQPAVSRVMRYLHVLRESQAVEKGLREGIRVVVDDDDFNRTDPLRQDGIDRRCEECGFIIEWDDHR